MKTLSRKRLVAAALAAASLLATARAQDDVVPDGGAATLSRSQPWDQDVLRWFRTLPVQDDGRIKPFDTVVSYALLRVHHKRTLRIPDEASRFGTLAGSKMSPVEWALDVMFHPEQAASYPAFTIDNDEVVELLGVSREGKKKRDRYGYAELSPARTQLMSLARQYAGIPTRDRTLVQGQTLELANALVEYERLSRAMGFARKNFSIEESPTLVALFGTGDPQPFSALVARWREINQRIESGPEDFRDLGGVVAEVAMAGLTSDYFRWFPPSPATRYLEIDGVDSERRWCDTGDFGRLFRLEMMFAEDRLIDFGWLRDEIEERRFIDLLRSQIDVADEIALLPRFEALVAAAEDPARFKAQARSLHEVMTQRTDRVSDYGRVELEVAYHDWDFFYKALFGFGLCFAAAALAWLRPRLKWTWRLVGVATLVPTALLVAGIVVRCIVRSRPPVTTLYETVVFITAVVVLVCLFVEWVGRRRVALSLAAFLGMVGMFLAYKFELTEMKDTMPTLVAVLDTNFWLATHVTTINMGYAAGLLAGFIAHVYLLGKLFGLRRGDKTFYRNVGRMVYGAIGFGIVFATVGTILGGIWANDSWGRFWGWDPKENGALLIVLYMLVTVHGRLGGYWRDHGIAILAVLGNCVVAFSWWGVNLLETGLHSYGFTQGLSMVVNGFYLSQLGVAALGVAALFLERTRAGTA